MNDTWCYLYLIDDDAIILKKRSVSVTCVSSLTYIHKCTYIFSEEMQVTETERFCIYIIASLSRLHFVTLKGWPGSTNDMVADRQSLLFELYEPKKIQTKPILLSVVINTCHCI